MPPDLSGVRAKLDRAQHHLEELRREVVAFREGEFNGVAYEQNPCSDDWVEHRLTAVITRQPDPVIAVVLGDFIQNLRASLDHLVWALARRPNGTTGFPIFTDRCEFQVIGEKRIARLSSDHRAFIESVQPYHRPYGPNDYLTLLNRLSNEDKHRLLLPIATGVRDPPYIAHDGRVRKARFPYRPGTRLENKAEIIRCEAPADMNVELKAAIDVGISGVDMDVLTLCEVLISSVKRLVIDPLAAAP
ncbi:MAG TPA: hypothetical protein PKD59_16235 [Miltoncostaeaceae bacterium]|nr:hypothetical protein [Miltoncostaeaceae bacterium]